MMPKKGNDEGSTDSIVSLFANGKGCNLTLINRNTIKEDGLEDKDPQQKNLMHFNSRKNSQNSHRDTHTARGKQGKYSKSLLPTKIR